MVFKLASRSARFTWVIIPFFLTLSAGEDLFAQSDKAWAFQITHENDAFSFASKGENYAGGIRAELITPHLNHKFLPFLQLKSPGALNIQRFFFGATGFTPQDIDLEEVNTDDRPYGSFTYAGAGRTSYDTERGIILTSSLAVGKIGGMLLGNLQRDINTSKILGAGRPVPEGWQNQVGHPGAWGFNYGASLTKSAFHSSQFFVRYFFRNIHIESDSTAMADSELVHIDSIMNDRMLMRHLSNLFVAETGFELLQTRWTAGGNVGMYMTNAYVGWQLDLFNINRYSLLNYIPDVVKKNYGPLHATHHRHGGRDLIRFNFFARPTLRLVGYNASLEGLMFNDQSALVVSHSDMNRVLFEFEVGANLLIAHRFNIIYTHAGRSREYAGGRGWNSWGGITLGFSPAPWNP